MRYSNSIATPIEAGTLYNADLSLKAKGLLLMWLAEGEDWQPDISYLATVNKEGREAIYAALKELIECGAVIRSERPREKGRMTGYVYALNRGVLS